jgi:hypothetical protein
LASSDRTRGNRTSTPESAGQEISELHCARTAEQHSHLCVPRHEPRPVVHATDASGIGLLEKRFYGCFVRRLFNNVRPHEALDMKCPADIYKPSTRTYRGIGELSYPFHDQTVLVTYCGRICIFKKKINLSTSLAGQAVGIKEVDEGIWLVSFMDYDLGYIDLEEKTLQSLDNPFGPKV